MRSIHLIFLIMCSTLMCAQKPAYFSVTAGGGATAVQNARWEMTGGFSANVANEKNMLGARALFSQEFILFNTPERVNEYALYYGRYFLSQTSTAFASLGGGFSYEHYALRGERYFPSNSFLGEYHHLVWKNTCGLAIDAQAGSNIGRFFSIGIHGFASVNPVKTTGGIMLSLRFGLLDERN